jgi:hypothetical protein
MGRVVISNVTDYELTVGPDGVLRPDLWFDAKLGGLANREFPGVAYDRIARWVVIPGKTRFDQLVRLDQGDLGQVLSSNPSASTQVLASVVTNPVATANGVAPGAAGNRAPFKAISRAGFPLSQAAQRKRAMSAVEAGTPAEKLRNLELMAACIRMLEGAKNLDEATRAMGTEFVNALNKSRDDAVPAVAAYATFLSARLSSPDARGAVVERLVASENWPARLLGMIAANGTGAERELAMAQKVAQDDPEPTLRAFAAATVDYLHNPPTTQPATQPTTQPGAGGAGTAPAGPRVGSNDAAPIPSGLSVPSQPAGAGRQGG